MKNGKETSDQINGDDLAVHLVALAVVVVPDTLAGRHAAGQLLLPGLLFPVSHSLFLILFPRTIHNWLLQCFVIARRVRYKTAMRLPKRDLAAEVAKHFKGTPEERVADALRAGEEALQLFLATLPAGTPRTAALDILRRNKHRGRRPSRVMEGRGS